MRSTGVRATRPAGVSRVPTCVLYVTNSSLSQRHNPPHPPNARPYCSSWLAVVQSVRRAGSGTAKMPPQMPLQMPLKCPGVGLCHPKSNRVCMDLSMSVLENLKGSAGIFAGIGLPRSVSRMSVGLPPARLPPDGYSIAAAPLAWRLTWLGLGLGLGLGLALALALGLGLGLGLGSEPDARLRHGAGRSQCGGPCDLPQSHTLHSRPDMPLLRAAMRPVDEAAARLAGRPG